MAGAITLSTGYEMPTMGLGVWRTEGKLIGDVILSAIKIGYRHFDCAADYHNEAEVGEALKEAFQTGLVKRGEIFITTKLWNSDHGHVHEACKDSMKKLQELELLTVLWMKMVCCGYRYNHVTRNYLACNGRSCPNGVGSKHWNQELAEKYDKIVAQLVLRWGLQRNAIVIPKTSKLDRLQENFQVSDFNISDEDMHRSR